MPPAPNTYWESSVSHDGLWSALGEDVPLPPENNRYPLSPIQERMAVLALRLQRQAPVRFGFIAGADGQALKDPYVSMVRGEGGFPINKDELGVLSGHCPTSYAPGSPPHPKEIRVRSRWRPFPVKVLMRLVF